MRPDKFDGLTVTYPEVATFASSQHGFEVDVTGTVDSSFPKGEAFRDWLANVGASPTPGQLVIHDGEHTVDAVLPGVSQQWITVSPDTDGHSAVQYLSFNTPVGGAECGRMVFSDLHVAAGTGDSGEGRLSDRLRQQRALAPGKSARFHALRSDVLRAARRRGADPARRVVSPVRSARVVGAGNGSERRTASFYCRCDFSARRAGSMRRAPRVC